MPPTDVDLRLTTDVIMSKLVKQMELDALLKEWSEEIYARMHEDEKKKT